MAGVKKYFGSLRRALQSKPRHRQQLDLPKVRLGSDYGGYAVAPHLLHADSVVYSCGIGEDASFDLDLIRRFGCRVHAFDPTPRALAWVASQPMPEQLSVYPLGLSDHDGVASFAPPRNPRHVSHSMVRAQQRQNADRVEFQVRRLSTLMAQLGHSRLDLLKMDIEGAEYAVIDSLALGGACPRQLLVEFHHHLEGVAVARTERALAQLGQLGYRSFDCQPGGREFSFLLSSPP